MTRLLTQILTQEDTNPNRYKIPEFETILPKFQAGEEVVFELVLNISAVIDEIEWDSTAGAYFYSVKGTKFIGKRNQDIYLDREKFFAAIDEADTSLSEEELVSQEQWIVKKSSLCEFDKDWQISSLKSKLVDTIASEYPDNNIVEISVDLSYIDCPADPPHILIWGIPQPQPLSPWPKLLPT